MAEIDTSRMTNRNEIPRGYETHDSRTHHRSMYSSEDHTGPHDVVLEMCDLIYHMQMGRCPLPLEEHVSYEVDRS